MWQTTELPVLMMNCSLQVFEMDQNKAASTIGVGLLGLRSYPVLVLSRGTNKFIGHWIMWIHT